MIQLLKTEIPDQFVLKDDDTIIGKYITKSGGIIFMKQKEPYRKLNAFGINKQLLSSKEIEFRIVIVECQKVYYMTWKKTLLVEGIEQEFDFGKKIFLPIPLWHSTASNQLILDFYFDGIKQ